MISLCWTGDEAGVAGDSGHPPLRLVLQRGMDAVGMQL